VGKEFNLELQLVELGDAFVGALCAEIAQGADIQHAAQIASIAGALATTVRGAVPGRSKRGDRL
jgi:sugar/nucleoside kinase (ribokinase family)